MKTNECVHLISKRDYAPLGLYLDSIVSVSDLEKNKEVIENLRLIYKSNVQDLKKKFSTTIDLLEKLKKHKFLIEVLETNTIYNVNCSMSLLNSYFEMGLIDKYKKYLDLVINYLFENKLWAKCFVLESIIDSSLFKTEFNILKMKLLYSTGQYDDLVNYVSSIQLKKDSQEYNFIQEIYRADIPELISFKLSLLIRIKNLNLDERLKTLIMFYNNESICELVALKTKSKIEYKIIEQSQEEEINFDYYQKTSSKQESIKKTNTEIFSYIPCEEEQKILVRLKLKDPAFENYKRDLAISFINLSMYEFVVEYLDQFELDQDGLYLKLECLNSMSKYSQVIDIINSNNLDESLAFRYLKAMAYKQMGIQKLARSEFLKVAKEDSNFRNTKEYLK